MEPKPPQERWIYHGYGHMIAIAGLGPTNWSWYKYPKMFRLYFKCQDLHVAYLSIICFLSQLIFLYLNAPRLDKSILSIVYSILPIGFLATLKVSCTLTPVYKKIMIDFMETIHLYNYYRMNRSEFVKTKLVAVERASAYFGVTLVFLMFFLWMLWMLTPIVYNIRNIEAILNGTDSFHTCYYMWMPFDYLNDLKNFIMQNIINLYVTFLAVLIIAGYDVLNYIIIFNLLGHIQILKHNIQTRFVVGMADDDVKRELIEIVHHHYFITKTLKDVNTAFGLSIAANYLQNLIEDGLLMYQFMLGDKESKVTYGLTLLYYMGGLVVMSVVLEEIRRETEDLSEILYCSIPWETMSLPNQRTFSIILVKMDPVLEFVALGCFKAGIMPAISIIKATFSYYVMIKARM